MGLSFSHLLLVLLIVLIVFGKGRISSIMGEIGKGVKSLRDGLKGDDANDKPDNKEVVSP